MSERAVMDKGRRPIGSSVACWLSCLYLCTLVCAAQAAELEATTTSSEKAVYDAQAEQVSVWVDDASLNFVVDQLAHLSGRQSVVDGTLDGRVSGRFSGSMASTLSALTTSYPVLFDVDSDALHAVSSESRSSVSIALPDLDLGVDYKAELLDGLLPGNSIEFRDDAVRVSGHPAFVSRMARSITAAIADNESLAAPLAISDAGSEALLQDIQEENQAATERAQLSKPIRWVTDIPGYTTF